MSGLPACTAAIDGMTGQFMALAASSSSDYSNFAMAADPQGFSADLGNFDMCTRQDTLQHCLAGSRLQNVDHVYLGGFAGLCVPVECGPDEMLREELISFLEKKIHDVVKMCQIDVEGYSCLFSPDMQQHYNYFTKLTNILTATKDEGLGYTCGPHHAWMTTDRWIFMTALGIVLLVVISATVYQMIRDNEKTKSRTSSRGYVEVPLGDGASATAATVSIRAPTAPISGFADKMVDAFSLIKNVPYVFSAPSQQPTNITASSSDVMLRPSSPVGAPKATRDTASSDPSYGATATANVVLSLNHNKNNGANGSANTDTVRETVAPARPTAPERFGFLDGLRTLSMLWIILGHTMTTCALNGITNPAVILPPTGLLVDLGAQFFLTARFAVDTFFFISGFLVAISLLKRLMPASPLSGDIITDRPSRRPPTLAQWLPLYYLHRLLRILPPYAFCLVLWWKVGVLLGSGPFWVKWAQYAARCDKYFWTNLLFINNLYPYEAVSEDQCFYVSWYLANDMQFYALSPIFILTFLKKKSLGVTLTSVAVLASVLYAYKWTFDTGGSAHSFDGANVQVYSQEFYSKPHFRFPPYGIGILVGMLRTWQQAALGPAWRIPPGWAASALVGAVGVLLFLMFPASWSAYWNRPCGIFEARGPDCGSNWSMTALALYNAFSKPLWASALGVITLLCCNSQGGILGRFLSHRIWGPPAKLSFAVYLLHVTVLNLFVLSQTQKWRYSHFEFAFTFLGIIFASFLLALFVAVFIESPACRISKQVEASIAEWYGAPDKKATKEGVGIGDESMTSELSKASGEASEGSRLV